jgi:hypothetical protein
MPECHYWRLAAYAGYQADRNELWQFGLVIYRVLNIPPGLALTEVTSGIGGTGYMDRIRTEETCIRLAAGVASPT